MREAVVVGMGGRVRTDTIAISIQAVPDLGRADNVDLVWVVRVVGIESCECEEDGVSDH